MDLRYADLEAQVARAWRRGGKPSLHRVREYLPSDLQSAQKVTGRRKASGGAQPALSIVDFSRSFFEITNGGKQTNEFISP
jgi:hypothetical protein